MSNIGNDSTEEKPRFSDIKTFWQALQSGEINPDNVRAMVPDSSGVFFYRTYPDEIQFLFHFKHNDTLHQLLTLLNVSMTID